MRSSDDHESLCIMEALSRSQNNSAVEHWQLQEHAMQEAADAVSHGIHDQSQQQQQAAAHHQQLISVDQLSRLTVNRACAAVDHQLQQQGCSAAGAGGGGGAHYDHMQQPSCSASSAAAESTRVDGPKLEDFLGGKSSLGGQYSDNRDHHHQTSQHQQQQQQQQLEDLYYNAAAHGAAAAAASCYQEAAAAAAATGQTRINVNLPYTSTHSGPHGGSSTGSLRDLTTPSSTFHLAGAYGSSTAVEHSSLALNQLNHCYEAHEQQQQQQQQQQQLQETNNLLAQTRSHLHAQNLLQSALDQQRSTTGSDHCMSLQIMPQSSSCTSAAAGLKSWLHVRHQAVDTSDSKAAVAAASFGTALASWQPLSLSMSAGSSHVTDHHQHHHHHHHHGHAVDQQLAILPAQQQQQQQQAVTTAVPEPRKRGAGRMGSSAAASKEGPSPRKSIDTFGQRTSVYRGVTRHRWTGRYEAHLWDNSCRKEGQTRKGRQVYLGGYDKEDKAARAYDLAALKYWGPSTTINFPLSTYEAELEVMKNMTRQEYVASLRRKSSGFSRGASVYRGVTRHHQHGRWQARIGRVAGNKDLYLGTYSTQEEAAEAYDIAAIKFRGANAVTNFDMSKYDPQKIHAAAVNGQHGQDFKCKATDHHDQSKLMITDHQLISNNNSPSTTNSDAQLFQIQDENQQQLRIMTSNLQPAGAGTTHGSRLELMQINTSTGQQDHHQLAAVSASDIASCHGLSKNLLEWQTLYHQQQQAAAAQQKHERNTWGHAAAGGSQDHNCSSCPHEGVDPGAGAGHGSTGTHLSSFGSDAMRAPGSQANNSSRYNNSSSTSTHVPSNGMLLRNLMGLEVLPAQDQHGGGGEISSCSAAGSGSGLMRHHQQHHHGLPNPAAASLLSSASHVYNQGTRPDQQQPACMQQPAGYDHVGTGAASCDQQQLQTSETRAISNSGLTYNQGSHDRSDMNMESPRNSVGESEEASSKNSTFDRVLSDDISRNLLFSASTTTTSTAVKMNPSYDSNPLSTWIGISNPLTLPTLTGRPANLSQMGTSPIFAHSWTE